jgi:hypothetical protein
MAAFTSITTGPGRLPAEFAELEPFLDQWDLPGTNERYARRLASSIGELESFFEVMMPRVARVSAYLDGKSFADYSDADRRLARLMFALGVVAPAVELFKRPTVPDTGAAGFTVTRETEL